MLRCPLFRIHNSASCCAVLLSPTCQFEISVWSSWCEVQNPFLSQFRWKPRHPLLDLICSRSFPSPWWTWASLPYSLALVMHWEFTSSPAVLWWGSWSLASYILSPESLSFFFFLCGTQVDHNPCLLPSVSQFLQAFFKFVSVTPAGTSVRCHWNQKPNLLGAW